MNLWFRLLRVLVQGLLRARVPWDARTRLDFRVWPLDLDLNLHMTNARYMALMDLGRMNLILQTGLGRLVVRERWGPVIASALVRFRRPLHLLEAFSLSTRIIGWDEKWIFIEHRLERGGDLICHALVKGLFMSPKGAVPPARIAEALGHDGDSPALPDWISDWMAVEAAQTRFGVVNGGET
jgi:acyl-CoA thioesterase FadM